MMWRRVAGFRARLEVRVIWEFSRNKKDRKLEVIGGVYHNRLEQGDLGSFHGKFH